MSRKWIIGFSLVAIVLFSVNLLLTRKSNAPSEEIPLNVKVTKEDILPETVKSNMPNVKMKHKILKKAEVASNEVEERENIEREPSGISAAQLSFTRSLSEGDARTPPIVRGEVEDLPSQEQLDDPVQYLDFQAQQRRKVLVSYVKAAKPKLIQLKKLVAEGEVSGISEKQLIEGRTKIQKIEEMLEQITADNPDLPN